MRLSVGIAVVFTMLLFAFSATSEQRPASQDEKATNRVTFSQEIVPFLTKYCTSCHGGAKPKGDLSLEALKDEGEAKKKPEIWERVAANLRSGDMPPPTRKRPTPAEIDVVTSWIDRNMARVDCTKERDPGRVTIRRLNKAEYRNTIRDLIGIDFKPAEDFPSDDVGYGFDNIGDVLTLSPLLMERYLAAAEQIVETAFKDPEIRGRIVQRPKFDPKDPKRPRKSEIVRQVITKFASKAYRRPATADEVARIARFVELAETNGETVDKGFQLAYQAVLVSPHFLFRVETDHPSNKPSGVHPVNEYELASRLSYFLWSSMPDEDLFTLAASNSLRQGDALEKQVRRMLADPKARGLTDNFAGQWLQLRSLKTAAPDPQLFPSFSEDLRRAMVEETERFFEAVVKEDRSILDFIDADFTFVNETLAKHYGIKGVSGKEFQRVKLPDDKRGGILTQASILTVTSNPTRTSPVKRGKWILENILNTPPPPPPPDVPELEENQAELKGSLRQRMEQHRQKALCASCHQRMDPLGFAFENFDAVGAWRDRDGRFSIDATGTLPNGQTFNGPKELRQILKTAKEGDFRRCLVEKMLTYALGRGLEVYDKCAVDDICTAIAKNNNRFSSLVIAIVKSDPFQLRKAKGNEN